MGVADDNKKIMTYKEYATWEDERCEVLDGKVISMAPSPLPEHQDISMQLSIDIGTYLRGKTCKVFAAPIDIYLFEDSHEKWIDENVRNWVIPDLIVVCDPNKIRRSKILGAPDLVVEIISPSSAKIDRMDKRLAYQQSGVKEYWIIDPANQIAEVYLLKKRLLQLHNVYNREQHIPVHIFEEFTIDLGGVFPNREEI
ncbi:Uma2 family endonuclease [Scopulibacillus darangshiensis]|uniref:Uma2 family endonuclease n=1 Tax=Scopulibacillus darangshiensis TaxID=442528 RepID=A0A4R2P2S6_9BACL|nr:Uma2 family endonuclease [Scopulibacillus darangshiensis]TCP29039.1 Uma2 family endonuclease [Scopulibacillus darangshiensis]